jgi:phosphatidylglycerol:prolipoprotein diacylglycerol transferase
MYPKLFSFGPFTLYSYGLMLALAVLLSGGLLAREAGKRMGIARDVVYDLVFWVVLSGIAGARLFYVFLNLKYFISSPLEIVMLWNGGLAWQGSFFGGLAAFVVYLRKKNIPVWRFLDLAAPYVALGHAIGRVGCLLNGCCYGKPVAWGLVFPSFDVAVHPTQVYMSLTQLVIFVLLRIAASRNFRDGQIFVWYLLLSSIDRFFIEFFRADHLLYAGLSIFQYVCLVVFMFAFYAQIRLNRTRS